MSRMDRSWSTSLVLTPKKASSTPIGTTTALSRFSAKFQRSRWRSSFPCVADVDGRQLGPDAAVEPGEHAADPVGPLLQLHGRIQLPVKADAAQGRDEQPQIGGGLDAETQL